MTHVPPSERHRLGLMGTIPIYWGEAGSLNDVIEGTTQPHWARATLEQSYILVPLDTLEENNLPRGLSALDRLMLAQPRALSPSENVTLDKWVRRGGHLLLFADPMLTGQSRFPIGDRRRPQSVILLSPILNRWGLLLQFDDTQARGKTTATIDGVSFEIDLAGTLRSKPTGQDAHSHCAIIAGGRAAKCRIGKGTALIIADAALLELDEGRAGDHNALLQIAQVAFPAD